MERVRPCVAEDIPRIAELQQRVWRGAAVASAESYLAEVLVGHPWAEAGLPSLVYEIDGRIVGCLGVMPRRFTFNGRPVRLAVSHNFMVDPERRSTLAAVHLMRAFLGGRQDVAIAESNAPSRRLWEGLGGTRAPVYDVRWVKPLSSARFALSLLSTRGLPLWGQRLLAPLATTADAGAARLGRGDAPAAALAAEDLTVAAFLATFPAFTKERSLRPDDDEASLRWVWRQVETKTGRGVLRRRLVRGRLGEPLGCYVYFVNADRPSEVVQVVARESALGDVLDHLFADARRHGVPALVGYLDPRAMKTLASRDCFFRAADTWTLVHAADPEIAAAFYRGDAFMTPCEGEWWINP